MVRRAEWGHALSCCSMIFFSERLSRNVFFCINKFRFVKNCWSRLLVWPYILSFFIQICLWKLMLFLLLAVQYNKGFSCIWIIRIEGISYTMFAFVQFHRRAETCIFKHNAKIHWPVDLVPVETNFIWESITSYLESKEIIHNLVWSEMQYTL